jgi:hypothetical protein
MRVRAGRRHGPYREWRRYAPPFYGEKELQSARQTGCGSHKPRAGAAPVMRARVVAGLVICLAAVAVVHALVSVNYGPRIHDEGIEANAGLAVSQGRLLYRDFYYEFPAAGPYALAAVFRLFGPSLIVMRLAALAFSLGAALVAAALAFRLAGSWWIAAGWLALVTIVLRSNEIALPMAGAMFWLLVGVAAAGVALRRGGWAAVGCGALIGFGAVWRLDVGCYFVAACLIVLAARAIRAWRRPSAGESALAEMRRAGAFAGGSLLVMAAALGPFFALAPRETYRCLAEFPRVVAALRDLPSPSPIIVSLPQPVTTGWPEPDLLTGIAMRGALYMPILAGLGLIAAWMVRGVRGRFPGGPAQTCGAADSQADDIQAILTLAGMGLIAYGTVRCDLPHLWPLALVGAALAPRALHDLSGPRRQAKRWVRPALCALLAALLVYLGAFVIAGSVLRLREIVRQRSETSVILGVPRGRAIHVSVESQYRPLLEYVRARVPPTGALFVGVPTYSRVRAVDILLYFLSERPPATTWYQFDPGITTSPWVQHQIIADLERTQPPIVVVYLLGSARDPEAPEYVGADLLDRYVNAHYRPLRTFGLYRILERTAPTRQAAGR